MNRKKLDIQLFASGASCTVTVSEVVGSATENTSTFTIKATVKTGSQTYNYSNAYVQGSYSGGASGSLSKQTFSINKSSSVSKSWTVTINHNPDGSLGDITFSIRFYVTDSSNGTTTKTVTPTRIARYFSSTPTLSFSSKTETTITFTWSTSEWCSAMSLSGGGTLSGFSAGTGGTITVSGLANNTPYTHYITCTRSDSGLNSNSNSLTNTTYQYPYINGVNANPLLIGNGQYLTIYNPLGRSVTVYMKKDNTSGTQFYSGTTSGTSISFTPNATTMYNSIPNTTEGNAIYYCVYSNQIISTPSGKYQTRTNEVPTFDQSYATISTNLDTFTNDNNTLISGKSTVTVSVNTAADCDNYGSSFSRYVILQNGATSQQLNSATGSVTLTGGTSDTITIQAYDTRGYHTDITKIIGEVVNYVNPSISGSTARVDGIGSTVKLFLSGNIYYEKFGSNGDTNQVTTLQYRTSTTTTFSGSYTSIPLSNVTYGTGSGNTRSYAVDDYQISGSYSLGTKYYVEVRMADGNGTNEFSNTSVVLQITSGLIARDVYLKNGSYHTGINGLGNDNYNEYVNGTFHSTGNISTGGNLSVSGDGTINGNLSVIKSGEPRIIMNTGTYSVATLLKSGTNTFLAGQGTIYFRPNDTYSNVGQAYINTDGKLNTAGEVQAGLNNSYGQFRAIQGNYGFMIRNDGSDTYFLLTNSGDTYGQWNGLRPLMISNGNGHVTLGNGLSVTGNTAITGDTTVTGTVHAYTGNLTSTKSSRYITIAPENVSFTHYQTNADAGHWFNKNVYVQGDVYAGSSYNRALAYQDSVPRVARVGWGTSMGFSLSDGQQAFVMLNHDQMAILWSVNGGTQINKSNIKGSGIVASISNSWVTITISGGGAFAGFAVLSP